MLCLCKVQEDGLMETMDSVVEAAMRAEAGRLLPTDKALKLTLASSSLPSMVEDMLSVYALKTPHQKNASLSIL